MKNIAFKVFALGAIILVSNLIAINYIADKHAAKQNNFLFIQTQQCGIHIETILANYENELNRLIFYNSQKIHLIFSDEEVMSDIIFSLQTFYKKYRGLLSNISIFNNSNNYLGLYIKDNDEFVVDTFYRQRANVLNERQVIIEDGFRYMSSFPIYREDQLIGNIVAEINLHKFLTPLINLFYVKDILWQSLVNVNTGIIFSNRNDSLNITLIDSIKSEILNENEGIIKHHYIKDAGKRKIVSSYYPLSVLNNDIGIVFSSNSGNFLSVFSNEYQILLLINFILFIIIISVFMMLYFKEVGKNENIAVKLLSHRMIIEHFPVGVMILDKNGIITNINLTGQKMLFLDNDEDLLGKSFHDQFLVSNKYLLKENINVPFDANHFLLYEKDGNEVVIYRKEIKTHIAGDELIISALIDVSPFEKSRKQEAAANMAKSDFLAKMSHEIRTPMNGIIGMTDHLLRSELPDSQKEQVKVIKKSSALLMNVINDILDFSKIEAGKMMLEEIPFNLNDEMKLTLELFKPLADEKDLKIITIIKPTVPVRLIGDPFRLRQVLSNLLSNAIKFTNEGKIKIQVDLLEKYTSSVVLLFSVEDTGIGMDNDHIKKLFSSYEQGQQSISRKYGGTGLGMSIARQLVEMMNGEIWAESPAGLSNNPDYPGSKFSFTIEAHSNEQLVKKFNFSSFNSYNQISSLILTKKKDEKDRMHTILDSFGISYNYKVYDDKTKEGVISHLEQKKDLYQLIVIKDKPGHDGFAIASLLKENRFSDFYLIIMISSNDLPGNYLKARNLGIDYYLIQPYESNEVYKILNENFPNIEESKAIHSDINQIRPGLRILVADDNLINQRVAQTIFKHLGYEIDIATNGIEALAMTTADNYDIVFMDLIMPEMDGFAAASEIRKTNKMIPIIAMTAADDQSSKDDAFNAGMNDYVMKPVKVEVVKQLLIKWFSESI